MHRFVFHNDRVLPLDQVRLSPGQAGLFNGWGVFTTLRVYDGVPFALEMHWNRLKRDADRVHLTLTQDAATLQDCVRRVIAANRVQQGCIRVYFILNKVSIWSSDEPFPPVDLIVYSVDLPNRVGPTQLDVMPHGRHAANPLTGTKVTSWLNNVWHLEQAHRRGFDDVILLNERGEVVECTAANIYCVRGQTVITPPASSGCLLGVTREILLELAPRAGVSLIERALSIPELYAADEVFISSTTRNVQAIRRIVDKSLPNAPGPITERLASVLSEYVKAYVEPKARSAAR